LPTTPPARRGVVVLDGEVLRAPGFAALLRRHPKLTKRTGVAAVAAGVLLFVVAGLATPLAGANTTEPKPAARAPVPDAATWLDTPPPARPSPAAPEVAHAVPVRRTQAAPADHGVISGLAANGVPTVALNAYRVAAARMANVQPGCGIDWALLAGIGREESDHGRFAGAALHADGVSTPKIIGPALDGVHWDYIPAPANGDQLDGDATYAHALGPMQFIPSTWALYGADATGDGRADIFNINDAALGAARYLCAAGGDLRQRAGQMRAVLAYNHNDQYLAQVLALADAYRRGVPITGQPVGITTGALPKVTDTGYLPPANPAAPTAVDKSGGRAKKGAPAKSAPARPKSSTSRATVGPGTTTPRPDSSATTPTSPASSPSTAKPSPTGSSSTPKPSPTCNQLQILLGCKG
jgi:membrane-bound lytic murein transglycosylase B